MKLRTKGILMNLAITFFLFMEFARGKPLLPIVIAGVILLSVTNLILLSQRKREPDQIGKN